MQGQRLAQARRRAGLAQVDLAAALDRDRTLITHVEAGRKLLGFDGAVKAAQTLKVSLDYLAGLTDDPRPSADLAAALDQALQPAQQVPPLRLRLANAAPPGLRRRPDREPATGEPATVVGTIRESGAEYRAATEPPQDLPSARYVEVVEVATAAGGGALIDDAPVKGYLAFQRWWLDRHAIDATQAVVISVSGESMEPNLPDGCSILVDRGRRRRRTGLVFVVQTEDGLVVKRAGKGDTGGWHLVSDHPEWPPVPWPARAEVVGQVRWMARSVG